MKSIYSIFILLLFSLPVLSFSQINGFNAIKKFSDAMGTGSSSQDTSKSKTGTQSNLAVTDEGSPGDKSKTTNKKVIENPIDKMKKSVTENAVQNNNTTGGTSNLAVTDAGDPGDKTKGKTARKTNSKDTSEEKPKEGSTTTPDPK